MVLFGGRSKKDTDLIQRVDLEENDLGRSIKFKDKSIKGCLLKVMDF